MKHIDARLVLAGVALWAVAASGQTETPDVYAQVMQQADQAGKLILFVYSTNTTCPISIADKDTLMSTGRANRALIVQYVDIDDDDQRYMGYRQRFEGNFIPFWVLTKPDGEYVAGGDGDTVEAGGQGSWRNEVAEAVRLHPPIGASDRQRITEVLAQANLDLQAGQYGKIEPVVSRLRLVWHSSELAQECGNFCRAYDAAVTELTAKPGQLADAGNLLEAAQAYQQVIDAFGRYEPHGKEAYEKQRLLLADHPDIRREFEALRRNPPPPAADAQAADPSAAQTATEQGESTDSADSAEPAPDDDEGAARLLHVAQMYHRQGMIDKAKAKLQECLDAYPQTPSAQQARTLLSEW